MSFTTGSIQDLYVWAQVVDSGLLRRPWLFIPLKFTGWRALFGVRETEGGLQCEEQIEPEPERGAWVDRTGL